MHMMYEFGDYHIQYNSDFSGDAIVSNPIRWGAGYDKQQRVPAKMFQPLIEEANIFERLRDQLDLEEQIAGLEQQIQALKIAHSDSITALQHHYEGGGHARLLRRVLETMEGGTRGDYRQLMEEIRAEVGDE